jgi:hypothetical protein
VDDSIQHTAAEDRRRAEAQDRLNRVRAPESDIMDLDILKEILLQNPT